MRIGRAHGRPPYRDKGATVSAKFNESQNAINRASPYAPCGADCQKILYSASETGGGGRTR